MNHHAIPAKLLPLVRYLDALNDRASLDDLTQHLRKLSLTTDDVRAFVQFDRVRYCRTLVAGGIWYDLLVLGWRSGQRSPIHSHSGSVCAVRVVEGICSETTYDSAPSGQVYPRYTVGFPKGSILGSRDAAMHQISNLEAAGRDLVTLHVYSPPLRVMPAFSMFGEAPLSPNASLIPPDASANLGAAI